MDYKFEDVYEIRVLKEALDNLYDKCENHQITKKATINNMIDRLEKVETK